MLETMDVKTALCLLTVLCAQVSCDSSDCDVPACIDGTDPDGCRGLVNGDYAVCPPLCTHGLYIQCSGGNMKDRNCAMGWYTGPDDVQFTYGMVFDPEKLRCELKTDYCPRAADAFVL